ncbi:hypothetical protein [Xylella fastidiosa]|uniref:hypothetical protein n=1 Tax=Xylella fastidiosa TaxID=2371 RepID=UPI003CCFA3C9
MQAGDLTVHARDITNTATGQLIANNLAQLTATATLTNRGLIDAFTTHLSAATIDNLGTGRLYGDHIALQAQTLTNRDETSDGHTHTATIAARQRLDIGADTLRNTANAMILSDGDAAIGATLDNALHATGIAALLDNRSATIDITGTLNITTTTLNNIRENVHIAHAPDVVTEARLEQPHWRKNKPNGGSGDFRLSSNYDAHEIYYLNPADILKDEPYITPDGQQIRRAIVRLTPQTSAYFYARGGLYASQAEHRRMDLTARTGDSVLLYYTDRQDKQPNPDHSAAAATNDSAFIGLDTPQQNERLQTVPITYAPGDDRLTYDPTYGTCTDDCVRLVTWHDYTDPDRTLIDMHRGPNDVRDNERERHATRTTQQEILNPDAGAPALIQSGGTMRIDVGYLYNHYADLLAGGDQTIVGLPPHPTKETADDEHKYNRALLIDNRALQLSRTDRFQNISTTYRGDTHTWTNESRTTPTTQIGGRITSGGHQHIAAQTFNNVTDSTHAPEPIQHVTYNPRTQTLTIADGHITVTDNPPASTPSPLPTTASATAKNSPTSLTRASPPPTPPSATPPPPPPSPSPPPAPSPCPTTASSPFTPTPPPSSPPTPALPSAAPTPAPTANSTPWATTTPSTNASATATTNNASSANKSPNSPAAAAWTATPTTTTNTAPSWTPASPSPNSTNCAPALPSVPTNWPNSPATSSGSSNKTSNCRTAPPPAPSSPASTCAPAPATSPKTAPSWLPPAPPSTPTPSPTPAPLRPVTSSTSTPTPWTNKAAASPPTPSTSTPPATSPPWADNSKPATTSTSMPKATSLLAAPCAKPPPKAPATTASPHWTNKPALKSPAPAPTSA